MQKPLELSQVQQQNGHGKTVTSGFFQSCHDHSQSAFPFCQTELPFHLHPIGLILIILLFVPYFILPRTSQCRAGQANTPRRTIAEILAVPIDFVRQHSLRIPACTSTILWLINMLQYGMYYIIRFSFFQESSTFSAIVRRKPVSFLSVPLRKHKKAEPKLRL